MHATAKDATMTKSEAKQALKYHGIYNAKQLKTVIDAGVFPDTQRYLTNEGVDLRNAYAWVKAAIESNQVSAMAISCALPR
jgi:hypothetical protein